MDVRREKDQEKKHTKYQGTKKNTVCDPFFFWEEQHVRHLRTNRGIRCDAVPCSVPRKKAGVWRVGSDGGRSKVIVNQSSHGGGETAPQSASTI